MSRPAASHTPIIAIVLLALLWMEPTEELKVKGCLTMVGEIVKHCYIGPKMPKDCSKKKGLTNLLKPKKKKKNQDSAKLLNVLDGLCNKCKGCKKDAKSCAITRLSVGSLKQCDLAQQLLKGLRRKK
ncbi:unnamed protein product [Dicrocoelium dendriticum]|nr:unnamed protein product [Dicrocoelium dendriticum]